jgi:hypothetical protein
MRGHQPLGYEPRKATRRTSAQITRRGSTAELNASAANHFSLTYAMSCPISVVG